MVRAMLSMSNTPFPVPGGARDTTEAGGGAALHRPSTMTKC